MVNNHSFEVLVRGDIITTEKKKHARFLLIHFQQTIMSVRVTVCSTKCSPEIAGRVCFSLSSKQCTLCMYRPHLCRADKKTNKRKVEM